MKSLVAAAFCIMVLLLLDRNIAAEIKIVSGRAMGTSYTLKLAGPSETTSFDEASTAVKDELERIETIFSLYRPESELSRWNEAKANEWIEVSEDLYLVAQFAMELSRETDGAFDPTVRPLMRLWQLDSLAPAWAPPSLEAIEECRTKIGSNQIEFQANPRSILKRSEAIQMDLNALVEGWAIDHVVSLLTRSGFGRALFELGGEFGSIGRPTDSVPWQVGIEDPKNPSRLITKVALTGESLCTSGNTKQGRVHRGQRYSHILDPRTGRPVDHDMATVSVLHASAMVADGWSTALLVLGPKASRAFAERKGLCVGFVRITPEGVHMSSTAESSDRFQRSNADVTPSSWPHWVMSGISVFVLVGFFAAYIVLNKRKSR